MSNKPLTPKPWPEARTAFRADFPVVVGKSIPAQLEKSKIYKDVWPAPLRLPTDRERAWRFSCEAARCFPQFCSLSIRAIQAWCEALLPPGLLHNIRNLSKALTRRLGSLYRVFQRRSKHAGRVVPCPVSEVQKTIESSGENQVAK